MARQARWSASRTARALGLGTRTAISITILRFHRSTNDSGRMSRQGNPPMLRCVSGQLSCSSAIEGDGMCIMSALHALSSACKFVYMLSETEKVCSAARWLKP